MSARIGGCKEGGARMGCLLFWGSGEREAITVIFNGLEFIQRSILESTGPNVLDSL